ncbi:MAG: glycosyltransferase [Bryobacteraceae bacterium]|nr:glycosyltransferase [Bryobacteraceae bacterium]
MVTTSLSAGFLLALGMNRALDTFLDPTFEGIHRLGWFDWALLIPYFTVLVILSLYGLHRYETMRLFLKHRKKLTEGPAGRWEALQADLPRVTIQLPIYNEKYVVERLIEETLKMDYPWDRLQLQVLDDSTDETHPFTEGLVARWQALGYPIEYKHRTNRHGFKAGALQEGLETATGEFVAVFDADFIPPPDFLRRTMDYFTDPDVGVVQTRWTYLNRHYNILTEVEAMLLDGHFVLEHGARYGSGLFFNFNGTAGILRKCMIHDAGGWQHDTLTEDSDLSYRAQMKGWKFVYIPGVECPSELPVEMHGFQVQQSRWSKGLTQVALKLLPSILRSKLPRRVKFEAFMHLTPNISYPLMVVVSALMLPVMIVRFYMGWRQMVFLDLPLIVASFWSLTSFYVYAHRELYPKTWTRAIWFVPALMAAGVALTISNTRAVIEALLGVQTAFVRTPKYAIVQSQKLQMTNARYRSRSGWLPYMELVIGSYFLYMIFFAIESYNFLVLPFLMIFMAGYFWAGSATLWQEWQGRMKWQQARRLELQKASSAGDTGTI